MIARRIATIGPSAPASSTSPAFSGSPRAASVRASQAAALSGWPSAAAPAPSETDLAVDLHHHARAVQVEPGQRLAASASTKKADEPLSATVSAKVIFQSAMRLSTISIAAWTVRPPRRHRPSCSGSGQVRAQHERDLASALGCRQRAGSSVPPSAIAHVIEQHAEIGLIDAQLRLHRLGGQARLAPDDAAALIASQNRVLISCTA
jgi:hypothetical protein